MVMEICFVVCLKGIETVIDYVFCSECDVRRLDSENDIDE